jgi:hypothetical protein
MSEELRPNMTVGDPAGDHISIRVLGRLHPGADDFWDGNWLATRIEAVVGKFQGKVGASRRVDELRSFREALRVLNATLDGEAVLKSMEEWPTLRINATSRGRLEVTGTVVDRLGDGTQLIFKIDDLDQSCLPRIIDSLDEVGTFFPVIGSPMKWFLDDHEGELRSLAHHFLQKPSTRTRGRPFPSRVPGGSGSSDADRGTSGRSSPTRALGPCLRPRLFRVPGSNWKQTPRSSSWVTCPAAKTPNHTEADDATIRAGLPSWTSTFEPVHAVLPDPASSDPN